MLVEVVALLGLLAVPTVSQPSATPTPTPTGSSCAAGTNGPNCGYA